MEAFAFEVWRRFVTGETAQQLATEFGIPVDRIELRLRAAERYKRSVLAGGQRIPMKTGTARSRRRRKAPDHSASSGRNVRGLG